jgi:hypothetical protein
MTKRNGVLVLGATIAAIGGCGSSPARSNAPATASAACMALHEASAQRSVRCLGGAIADWRAYAASQDDCAGYDRNVAEGQVEYVTAGWDACVAEYDGPCDKILSSCFHEVLHGLVADGQPCQEAQVCGTNAACFSVGGATCGDVCARAPKENERCGLHCDDSGTPCIDLPVCFFDLSCQNGTCVKAKATGAACGAGEPVPCSFVQHCTADPSDPASAGTCQPRAAGGPCHVDADCPDTEFCLAGSCAVRRAPGQSCADAPLSCAAWTVCDAGGVCAPAGRPGLPCAPYPGVPDFLICATGTCDGTLCVASASPGDVCGVGTCASGSACDLLTSTCVACQP